MTGAPALRVANPSDRDAISALLRRSYPVLLAPDYDAETLAAALPHMTDARPELVGSGRYFLAEAGTGHGGQCTLLSAGGWSTDHHGTGTITPGEGHVRHVVTDPAALRRGLARIIVGRCIDEARQAGLRRLTCHSTLTAVPFYAALGFADDSPGTVILPGGTRLPAVRMTRAL